jgi:ribonuclease HII
MTMKTLGIDEVGRGSLAGPTAVGAVILTSFDGEDWYDSLTDSKKLTPRQREKLDVEIKKHAAAIGVGWASAKVIDQISIMGALKLAASRAVAQIDADYDQIIIDGNINLLPDNPKSTTMIRADGRIKAVSAASIVAKVARDNYMKKVAVCFSNHGFENHVGYGTAQHLDAIKKHGATPIHRQSFAPLAPSAKRPKIQDTIGRQAEAAAAQYLSENGHTIIEKNWRTKVSEIDIISRRADEIYFHEVKYRRNDRAGDGVAAITPKKLQQLKKGVAMWFKLHDETAQPVLTVISMSGNPPQVVDFIKNI